MPAMAQTAERQLTSLQHWLLCVGPSAGRGRSHAGHAGAVRVPQIQHESWPQKGKGSWRALVPRERHKAIITIAETDMRKTLDCLIIYTCM